MQGETVQHWSARVKRAMARIPSDVDGEIRAWSMSARAAMVAAAGKRRKTGALESSIDVDPAVKGVRGTIAATSTDPAALVMEQGGPIKGSPWLAIPLRDGVRSSAGPRGDADLFVLESEDGRLFLASHAGGSLDLRWKLQRNVQRRATPLLRPALEAAGRKLPRLVLDRMAAAMKRGA